MIEVALLAMIFCGREFKDEGSNMELEERSVDNRRDLAVASRAAWGRGGLREVISWVRKAADGGGRDAAEMALCS